MPITSQFNAQSTAAQVVAGIDLTGRRAIVTGGASGIGIEVARALAGAGAEVTIAVRSLEQGTAAAANIANGVRAARLDLADLASVGSFVDGWDGPLHILINNAALMRSPLMRTPQGWEMQFATNHLGHFALATGLHRWLATANGARIVAVTSSAHLRAPVDLDDINFNHREYDPQIAYDQSKTANILFAVEATSRWAGDGITANAVNPGGVRSNLQRYLSDEERARMEEQARKNEASGAGPGWKTPEQGAATSTFVATSPLLDGVGGRYFEDCNESGLNEPGTSRGVAAYAIAPDAAARLWNISEEATRLA
jgi:NAD(P)-dependent dehydrogenase (short-subunit alcohol dehydrogenase family)